MNNLNDSYWSDRYQKNQTGWNIGYVSTPLKAYFDQLTNKNLRILIPGCGNSYEAEYLLKNGFTNITLIDISEVLVKDLTKKLLPSSENCKVFHQDFFEHLGQYDLIIEQTFFCAIDPTLRQNYISKMQELLAPKGKIVGVMFDVNFEGGPPFGGSKAEYEASFKPFFNLKTFESCYNSIEPRAGNELLVILEKK
jgi:methyl halide transferase